MPSQLAQTDFISQSELRRAFTLKLEIDRLQRQLGDIHEGFYAKVKAGARVEPGPLTIEIQTYRRGRTRGERVRIR